MDRLIRSSQTNPDRDDQPAPDVMEQAAWVIAIEQVEHLRDYVLRLKFNDGQETELDFEPFLRRSLNPLIRKYLDPTLFGQFTVEYGDLFFTLANIARREGVDPEAVLREANGRFYRRFTYMEGLCRRRGVNIGELSFTEQNALWEEAKRGVG